MGRGCYSQYSILWIRSISEVKKTVWDELALALKTPFLEWDWLYALENSGSASQKTGWLPMHVTIWDQKRLVAAAPMYLKTHGDGEFIVDSLWAELADRLGSFYYPKLVGMSPFTPLEGYRFLIDPGEDEQELVEIILREIDVFCLRHGIFSCNFHFVDPEWKSFVETFGYLAWKHENFIWQNCGLQGFDQYLQSFKSIQRRNIKRECQSMSRQGLNIKIYKGTDFPADLIGTMYECYAKTNEQYGPWGCKYLSLDFFEQIYHLFGSRILNVVASKGDRVVAMAFLVYKKDRVYGRYWGSLETIKDLHFNVCYYTPIKWAIDNEIKRFDPGIGGKHKLRRGFRLTPCYSLHRFYDRRLQLLAHSYIKELNTMEQEHIDLVNSQLPLGQ
ncbi:MAG TPA: GNAT family N-acetyltransferase [Desulfohalobiaceae bacterium]|nr:GNAT family N-acetyltransferase [Desulfohalobiaceae bacterium]